MSPQNFFEIKMKQIIDKLSSNTMLPNNGEHRDSRVRDSTGQRWADVLWYRANIVATLNQRFNYLRAGMHVYTVLTGPHARLGM